MNGSFPEGIKLVVINLDAEDTALKEESRKKSGGVRYTRGTTRGGGRE
jgi:hypothetical protein